MPRKNRAFQESGVYHIIQRGNNKAYVFNEHTDKSFFLELAEKIMESDTYYMLTYVLMDNHYHLLVEMKEAPVSKIMHKLNMGYSKYFNKKYGRTGTIFGERYKCIPVYTQAQFISTVEYILFNPVKAALVNDPSLYRWSSHFEMESTSSGVLSNERLFWRLSHSKKVAVRIYQEILQGRYNRAEERLNASKRLRKDYSIQFFFEHWSKNCSLRQQVSRKNRTKPVVEKRVEFVVTALDHGYDVDEIARFLNYSNRGINKILQKSQQANDE